MLTGILENLLVMVLTIVVMIAGAWLFLLFLQFIIKLKTGRREEDGLFDLWQSVITKPENAQNNGDSDIPPVSNP